MNGLASQGMPPRTVEPHEGMTYDSLRRSFAWRIPERFNLGVAYHKLGNFEKAARAYTKATALKPVCGQCRSSAVRTCSRARCASGLAGAR